jgi:hypothetical protein
MKSPNGHWHDSTSYQHSQPPALASSKIIHAAYLSKRTARLQIVRYGRIITVANTQTQTYPRVDEQRALRTNWDTIP